MDPAVNWPGWEFVRKLGTGSYGAVYEIRQQLGPLERSAALKIIPVPRDESELEDLYMLGYDKASVEKSIQSQADDVIREFSVMMELKGYTNIVYGEDLRCVPRTNGSGMDVCIQMELLTPLVRALQPEHAEQQAMALGMDMLQALAICQERKIIHRDIKPQNIFVSRSGDYKLGDFGVAKTMDRTGSATKIGTVNYMAPEVYHGEHYGPAADVCSLGMVLYWLLNDRRLPFVPILDRPPKQSEVEQAASRRFCGEALPPPKHGSEELKQIVCRMCAFRPEDRPGVAELQNAFRHLWDGKPVIAAPEVSLPEPEDEGTIGILPVRDAEPKPKSSAEPEKAPDQPDLEPAGEEIPGAAQSGAPPQQEFDTPQRTKRNLKSLFGKTKRSRIALAAAAAVLALAACILLFVPNGACLLLGHQWESKSKYQIAACSRCGQMQSDLNVKLTLADGKVERNNNSCNYYELSTPVNGCSGLAIRFGITRYTGDALPTNWAVIGRYNGEWSKIGSFKIDEKAVVGNNGLDNLKPRAVSMVRTSDFDAIACIPDTANQGFAWGYLLKIESVQVANPD